MQTSTARRSAATETKYIMKREQRTARAFITTRANTFVQTPSFLLHRYGFKARQRFRTAHDDLVDAISKKDEDLHNALKNIDPATLQDFEEKAVSSSGGVGIYRQKERVGGESSPRRQSPSIARRKKSPEQLRDKFAQSLEVLRDDQISQCCCRSQDQ